MKGKPAGSVVRLPRFRWHPDDLAPEPLLGMFLVTEAGSGYEIIGIDETGKSGPECDPRVYNLTCVKTEPSRIPAGAWVGSLYWQPRSPRA